MVAGATAGKMGYNPAMMRLLLTLLLVLVPLSSREQPAPGPPAVGVVRAERQQVTQTDEFIGRIQSIGRVALVARVTAFLEKRLFVEGAEVKKNDLLYQLEQPPFQAQVDFNKANVAQLEAQHRNAELTLERAQYLLKTVAGQQSNVDSALASERSLAAQIAGAQAQLQTAEINLGYTEIRAPIDGKISATEVTEGNVVSPTSGTLANLVSQDPMYALFPVSVRAGIDLRNRYQAKGGFNAVVLKLRLPDGRIYEQTGKLDYVSPTVATNTDTITVRGVFPNPLLPGIQANAPAPRELFDGEFVTVLQEGVQPITVLAIPRAAVLSDQQGDYVYVVDAQNKAQQRRIQLGQSTPSTAVVSSGLQEGELVISEGLQRARPGQVVSPGPASPPPEVAPRGASAPSDAVDPSSSGSETKP
ncbi:MAG TPA: efflux RND transporter periplasmic adaptor subunit [Stellaceae bacterium]|jgi:membrane fusion protein (multidrug efflux system)|nr:efflux RND transporter periplasmic adaptor subunit [Stellaceae bacterium]HEX4184672.1 efflux RND transporter periplasmic adaptor subunit [Stellaceae bacterium]